MWERSSLLELIGKVQIETLRTVLKIVRRHINRCREKLTAFEVEARKFWSWLEVPCLCPCSEAANMISSSKQYSGKCKYGLEEC